MEDKYIIRPSYIGFTMEKESHYKAWTSNAYNKWDFSRAEGFKTLDDVMDYVIRYFGLKREQLSYKEEK